MAVPWKDTPNLQRGRVMKNLSTLILRNSLLLFATLLVISNLSATAQTTTQSTAQVAAPITKGPAPRITQAIDEAILVPLRTQVHPLAKPQFDRGIVSDSTPVKRVMMVLQRGPDQETALRSLLDQQQTKNSPNYHAWLTAATFGQQFGVADADVQKVTAWLAQKGFTGIKAGPDNMFIEFSGTVGMVRNAFHTEIHNFTVNGEAHMANVSVPQIPAALSPVIASIHSLHNFRAKSQMHYSQALLKAKAEGKLNPEFGNGNGLYAIAPGDLATIYHLPSSLNGSGQTVALVAQSNITQSDINQFGQAFGLANLTAFTYANNVIVNGSDPGIVPGDDGETTLDVEMVGSIAPQATIKVVVSDFAATLGAQGIDLSAFYIMENNIAKIASESYGGCELADPGDPFYQQLWEFGASEGITITVSTGDTGSAGCDNAAATSYANVSDIGPSVNEIASTPFNVAVGGTDFNDLAKLTTYWNNTAALATAKSYIPEIPWNGSCASAATAATLNTVCSSIDSQDPSGLDLSGGAGGQSSCAILSGTGCVGYPKPTWQTGVGVPADGVRDLPDVSLFAAVNTASTHFIVICLADSEAQNGQPCNLAGPNYNFTGVGGTSASSPAFAGIMALVNQSETTAGRLKAGDGQGNVNYVLYKLAAAQNTTPGTSACSASSAIPASACTFNDVTTGNNSVACIGISADLGGNTPNCSTAGSSNIGVLVEPASPPPFSTITPAFTATPGYDLATGLGSVNVTNLTTNWGSITSNFTPSTTTITAPASVTIAHGATVNFTVKVAPTPPATGTPTGDVSLIAEPTGVLPYGLNSGTLASGTVPIQTLQLPGGTYPVVAHYAGDGTFAPSDSAPFSVTVAKEASATVASMWDWTGNPVQVSSDTYGGYYLFRVDVTGTTPPENQQCSNATVVIACPTGTVTLTYDGGKPLNDFLNTATGVSTNTAPLGVLGFTEDLVRALPGLTGGAHTVVATYSGDISFNASTSTALAVTINPASTTTSVTANGLASTTVSSGQAVTLVATIGGCVAPVTNGCAQGSNGAGPTGSATFSACGTATSCTKAVVPVNYVNGGTVAAYATATLPTTFTTPGTQVITATFATADGNYVGCTAASCVAGSATVTVTGVGPAAKLAFTGQPSAVVTGASITPAVAVTIQDASGNTVTTATNQVTLALLSNPGGSTLGGTLTATPVNGVATFSNLSLNKAGTGYTLTATSAPVLTAATSATFNVSTSTGPAAKLAFTGQPSNVNTGASITPAVAVTVQDASGNTVTNATNQVTIAIGANPGSGTLGGTLTAAPVNGIATFSNLTISAAGTGYTLMATSGTLTSATSSVFNVAAAPSFTVSATPSPVILLSATGATSNAIITVSSVNGWVSPVTVVCPTSLPAGVTCTPPSAITPPANGNATGMLGLAVAQTSSGLTASIASPSQILDAKTTRPTSGGKGWWTLSTGTGFAALFLFFLPCGRKRFRVALGLGLVCLLSFSLGCSNNGTPVVPKTATTTKMTVNANKVMSGTPFTFSVAVSGGTPTGMVQLFDGTTAIGAAAAVSGGTAAPTAPALTVGTHAISAHYLGDSTTLASASGSLNMTVTGNTTIAITTTPSATPLAPPINITIN
jgi:Pro-kumamolisin, activation domain/Bacterial Ig-like domain (group 3)